MPNARAFFSRSAARRPLPSTRLPRSRRPVALFCFALLAALPSGWLDAVELETELTSRVFVPVTDSEAGNYEIDTFRMNADATVALFVVRLRGEDPRGCTTRQQIRLADLVTHVETVVYTGFTYDTGVGNFCRSSLDAEAIAISDDGGTVVFERMENRDPDPPLPEIVLYDVESAAQQILLRELPYRSFGSSSMRRIDPYANNPAPFSLSGDGEWLWFVNRFGPWGPPGDSGEPGPSLRTLYRVAVPGGLASAELEDRQLPLAGLHPNATSLVSNARFPVSTDGSVALVSAGNLSSAPFTPGLLAVRAGEGASIVYNNPVGLTGGHAMSGDASLVVFGNRGSDVEGQPERLIIVGLDENLTPGPAQVLDPDTTVSSPMLSRDGAFALYWEGQRLSTRWASTVPGGLMREINQPGVRVWSQRAEISGDGLVQLVYGSAKSDRLDTSELPRDLLVSFLAEPRDMFPLGGRFMDVPFAHWAAGDPALCFHRDPNLNPAMVNTYQYLTVGEVSSAFSYGFDAGGRSVVRNGMSGLNDFGDLYDDGATERDTAAGDGVFSDTGLRVSDLLYPEGDDVVHVRLALANEERTASHHDVTARVLEPHAGYDTEWITTFGALVFQFGDTGVTMRLPEPGTANGYLGAQYFTGTPPEPSFPRISELPGAAPGYWRVLEGPAIQTSPVLPSPDTRGRLEFDYSLVDLGAVDLEVDDMGLFLSLDCGLGWIEVDSEVDKLTGVIRTRLPRSSWGGHWAIAERGTKPVTVLRDDFELGSFDRWSSVSR